MRWFTFTILTLELTKSVSAAIYVDATSSSESHNGEISSPYLSLTEALNTPESPLQVVITSNDTLYSLTTLGSSANISIACASNFLRIDVPMTITRLQSVDFISCDFSSKMEKRPSAFLVHGEVRMVSCYLHNFSITSFVLCGQLTLSDSTFTHNSNSLIAATMFGFELVISNCTFESNTSPAGAVFLMQLTSIYGDGATSVQVQSSVFRNNSAVLGGAVLLVSVNEHTQLSSNAALSLRSFNFLDCVFASNRESAFVMYSKFITWNFTRNSFVCHDHLFVVSLYSDFISFKQLTATQTGIVLVMTVIHGLVEANDMQVSGIIQGPAFYLKNTLSISESLVSLSNLHISNITTPQFIMASGTIVAINVLLTIDNYTVSFGFSMTGTACIALGSSVTLSKVQVSDFQANTGGLVLALFTTISMDKINMHSVKMYGIGWILVYCTTIILRNLTVESIYPIMNMGGSVGIKPFAAMVILGTFNSESYVYDSYLSMPDVRCSPPFFITDSKITIDGLIAPVVRSSLIVTIHSQVYVSHVQIGYIAYFNAFYFLHYSSAQIESVYITNGSLTNCLCQLADQSNAVISNVTVDTTFFSSFLCSTNANIRVDQIYLKGVRSKNMFSDLFRR